MALAIKGIESAKPKIDKSTGKVKPVRLADGNGLFWKWRKKANAGGCATSLKTGSRCFLWVNSRSWA